MNVAAVEARAVQIDVAHAARLKRLELDAIEALNLPADEQLPALRVLVDKAAALVAPFTPCREGCSYCCNMAVAVTQEEARQIALHTGREAVTIAGDLEATHARLEANVRRYSGVPCPFLVDSRCSIYEIRPMACRAHHSLADDAEPCDLSKSKSSIPAIDLKGFETVYAITRLREGFGDIREFFPDRVRCSRCKKPFQNPRRHSGCCDECNGIAERY